MIKKITKHIYLLLASLVLIPQKALGFSWIKCDNPPYCSFEDFWATFNLILSNMLKVGITFSVVVFVVAGWTYMTSAGNSGKVQKAHDMITKAVIGLVNMLTAF
jgi:hypothetical protein